mmetsp:Transcript_19756/g.50569  ORF Transcript_19756/g.50569 Transcript_19756/m.50569 type:complete len:330 (-) Transcript_19756:902-1891(-)
MGAGPPQLRRPGDLGVLVRHGQARRQQAGVDEAGVEAAGQPDAGGVDAPVHQRLAKAGVQVVQAGHHVVRDNQAGAPRQHEEAARIWRVPLGQGLCRGKGVLQGAQFSGGKHDGLAVRGKAQRHGGEDVRVGLVPQERGHAQDLPLDRRLQLMHRHPLPAQEPVQDGACLGAGVQHPGGGHPARLQLRQQRLCQRAACYRLQRSVPPPRLRARLPEEALRQRLLQRLRHLLQRRPAAGGAGVLFALAALRRDRLLLLLLFLLSGSGTLVVAIVIPLRLGRDLRRTDLPRQPARRDRRLRDSLLLRLRRGRWLGHIRQAAAPSARLGHQL